MKKYENCSCYAVAYDELYNYMKSNIIEWIKAEDLKILVNNLSIEDLKTVYHKCYTNQNVSFKSTFNNEVYNIINEIEYKKYNYKKEVTDYMKIYFCNDHIEIGYKNIVQDLQVKIIRGDYIYQLRNKWINTSYDINKLRKMFIDDSKQDSVFNRYTFNAIINKYFKDIDHL